MHENKNSPFIFRNSAHRSNSPVGRILGFDPAVPSVAGTLLLLLVAAALVPQDDVDWLLPGPGQEQEVSLQRQREGRMTVDADQVDEGAGGANADHAAVVGLYQHGCIMRNESRHRQSTNPGCLGLSEPRKLDAALPAPGISGEYNVQSAAKTMHYSFE